MARWKAQEAGGGPPLQVGVAPRPASNIRSQFATWLRPSPAMLRYVRADDVFRLLALCVELASSNFLKPDPPSWVKKDPGHTRQPKASAAQRAFNLPCVQMRCSPRTGGSRARCEIVAAAAVAQTLEGVRRPVGAWKHEGAAQPGAQKAAAQLSDTALQHPLFLWPARLPSACLLCPIGRAASISLACFACLLLSACPPAAACPASPGRLEPRSPVVLCNILWVERHRPAPSKPRQPRSRLLARPPMRCHGTEAGRLLAVTVVGRSPPVSPALAIDPRPLAVMASAHVEAQRVCSRFRRGQSCPRRRRGWKTIKGPPCAWPLCAYRRMVPASSTPCL
ncbi:uncharacterized protein PSFLO_06479 [Pseudozyma flocculosa]|uniref:Uncharacterized protein n=1 Tax=Pseudozyma flocculosa TaxID=84751 RepID=A0A5C3FBG5_9BASI|nr:uncharacterized protein PSFLO_06479 [Pseudozyma flocculosa]